MSDKKSYEVNNDTRANAEGKWRGILLAIGFTEKELSGKHGPCPMCEGTDRFRYTDYKGGGEYFCARCGPGSGFDLIMHAKNWDFAYAAKQVDKLLGTKIEQVFKPKVDLEKRRRDMNAYWQHADRNDLVMKYLSSRGITVQNALLLKDLRGHAGMFLVGSSDTHEGMLALIRNADGQPISLHRTYFKKKQRKVMPPLETIKGAAIRLGDEPTDMLVIGEGIETTLSGMQHFGSTAGYATISAGGMEAVQVPEVKQVIILADNDKSFTGQKAAFTLARSLDNKDIDLVRVVMPTERGMDFNDKDAFVVFAGWDNGS
ncbi:MAG: toprim domain-containing protein [Dehalococcoidales bacterium]